MLQYLAEVLHHINDLLELYIHYTYADNLSNAPSKSHFISNDCVLLEILAKVLICQIALELGRREYCISYCVLLVSNKYYCDPIKLRETFIAGLTSNAIL